MKKIILSLLLILVLTGCSNKKKEEVIDEPIDDSEFATIILVVEENETYKCYESSDSTVVDKFNTLFTNIELGEQKIITEDFTVQRVDSYSMKLSGSEEYKNYFFVDGLYSKEKKLYVNNIYNELPTNELTEFDCNFDETDIQE